MEKLDLDVNQFPTLTYNFLNINRTHLTAEITSSVQVEKTLLPKGITLEESQSLMAKDLPALESGMGKEFDSAFDKVISENKLNIYNYSVEENAHVESPVRISFLAKEKCAGEIVIRAKKNSSSDFIIDYSGSADVFGLRIKIIVDENAFVNLSTVNLLSKHTECFTSMASLLKDCAKVSVVQIELGSKKTITGNYINLLGLKAFTDNDFAYVTDKDQVLDINYVARHTGKQTQSFMNVKGVVNSNGQKTWRGTIDFVKGCKDSKGDEREDVLLLNPLVVNKSLPVILCDEEAVEGSHGASIGKLSQSMLFYMQSRGVDEKTAEKILTKAKIMNVAKKIKDEQLIKEIKKYLDEAF